jgi:hypothetical protein
MLLNCPLFCSQDDPGCFSDMRIVVRRAQPRGWLKELVIKLKDNITVYTSGMQTAAGLSSQCDPTSELS